MCKETREKSQLGKLFPDKVLLCVQWLALVFNHFRMRADELINISCDYIRWQSLLMIDRQPEESNMSEMNVVWLRLHLMGANIFEFT